MSRRASYRISIKFGEIYCESVRSMCEVLGGVAGTAIHSMLRAVNGSSRKVEWIMAKERERQLGEKFREELNRCLKSNRWSEVKRNVPRRLLKLIAMKRSIEKVPVLYHLIKENWGERFEALKKEVSELEHQPPLEEELKAKCERVESELTYMVRKSHGTLKVAEVTLISNILRNSLQSLGYYVSKRGNYIRGIKGRTCIWAKITSDGELEVDTSGFSGLSCMKAMMDLERELAKRGLKVSEVESYTHGDPGGGTLAGEARRIFGLGERSSVGFRTGRIPTSTLKVGEKG